MSVNHLDHYVAFRRSLEGRKRVAVLGAGLIGCEMANDLSASGVEVKVFDLAPQALGRMSAATQLPTSLFATLGPS